MKISEIPLENRPRERLYSEGINSLSNSELLAIILQKGSRQENVIDLSNRILKKFPLETLSKCSLSQLQEIHGIGFAKASQILACFEITKRIKSIKNQNLPVKCAKDVFNYIHPIISHFEKEVFVIIHLDTRNVILKHEIVSIGTLNSALIHPREVFKSAIKENSNSIIIVHNHPSGDPSPSREDRLVTDNLKKSGELLNIKVLDHVIVGKDEYFSFVEE